MSEVFDLIIVGAGSAGLTAGIYASRYKLKTIIFGKMPGGMISEAFEVHNFPSYKQISGIDLSQKMIEQVNNLGVEINFDEVTEIKKNNNLFEVTAGKNIFNAKKVLLAIGTERRKLNVKGEKEFLGKGVSYCATCDAMFFKDKIVGVVGGSDSALTAAIMLSEHAKKVFIIYRSKSFFRAEPTWVEQVEKNPKIESIFNSNIIEILGTQLVEGIKLDSGNELNLNGIFVEIGSLPDTKFSEQLGLEIENNFIKVDKKQKTNIKGILAAGDITNNPLKQAVTACSEGAIAANTAYEEIKREDN